MPLGSNIKEHRKRCGLSQEKLAEMVGVSRQAVTKWETGQSAPSTENLIRLAEIFSIPLDALISSTPAEAVQTSAPPPAPAPAVPPRPVTYVQPAPPAAPLTEEPSRKWSIWRKISFCLFLIGLFVLMPMGLYILDGISSDELAAFDVLAKILGVCCFGGWGCQVVDLIIRLSKKEY